LAADSLPIRRRQLGSYSAFEEKKATWQGLGLQRERRQTCNVNARDFTAARLLAVKRMAGMLFA